MFDFTGYSQEEIKTANLEFSEFIQSNALKLKVENLPDIETRIYEVETVTENFFNHFGQHMNTVCLYYLSNYLLQDFIKEPSRTKTLQQDNGFLSPRQLAHRKSKEIPLGQEVIDGIRAETIFCISKPKRTVNLDDV